MENRIFRPQLTSLEIDQLQQIYREAIYEVYAPQKTIRLYIDKCNTQIDRLLQDFNHLSWTLITAFNPYSQSLSPSENQQRHQNLLEYLRSHKFPLMDAVGRDPNGQWSPELSVFIIGISLATAQDLGRLFEQNALVYGELGKPVQLQWL